MNKRTCPRCYCSNVIKHGKQTNRQRYRCRDCGKTFTNVKRQQRFNTKVLDRYIKDDLKVRTLSQDFGLSKNTIRQIIRTTLLPTAITQKPRSVSAIMDTTYFKRAEGLLVVIDPNAIRGENKTLYYAFLNHTETNQDYLIATDTIEAMGYQIISATIDGRRGVKEMLESKGIPVQHCQFHQLQTINQCLTKNPILLQHKELRNIALTLTRSNQETFSEQLDSWYLKYGVWLKERYIDEHGGSRYKHARCRRAYFSLRRNLPNLFTYQQDKTHKTRNTTSPLDGYFGNLKDKLKPHRGITKTLKTTMICSFLSGATGRDNN